MYKFVAEGWIVNIVMFVQHAQRVVQCTQLAAMNINTWTKNSWYMYNVHQLGT